MSNREFLSMPANQPQEVTWFLANYYPTNASGQVASVVGVQFQSYNDAVTWARAKLVTEGVGCVYIQQVNGAVVFPLFEPVPN